MSNIKISIVVSGKPSYLFEFNVESTPSFRNIFKPYTNNRKTINRIIFQLVGGMEIYHPRLSKRLHTISPEFEDEFFYQDKRNCFLRNKVVFVFSDNPPNRKYIPDKDSAIELIDKIFDYVNY